MGGLFGGGKAPQAQKQQPAGALNIQTSVFGSAYPLVYGKNRVPVNLIHYFNFKAIPHTQKQKTGGKGGPKATSTTTYTYQVSFAAGFAVGGIAGVGTVWKNKEKHTVASLGLTLFTGGAGQTVWAHLASARPAEAVPYANLAYIAHPAFDLGDSPSLPNLNIEAKGLVPFNAGTIDDALASDIIVDYLTNARHGAGFGSYLADLDAGTNSYRKYCLARGLFISPIENNQRQAGAFIKDMAEMTNSAIVWREGKLNLIPYGDVAITGNGATYTPDLTPKYALSGDDFLHERDQPPVRHKTKPQEQAYNHLRMEYNARSNDYNPLIVEVKDQADIDENGLRTKAVTKYTAITLDTVARDVLQLQLQRDLFVVNTYSFRLGVRHSLLEPMDLVTLTEPGLNLNGQLVRIIDVVEQDDAIDVVAEEMNVGNGNAPLYATQPPLGYNQDFNVAPGPVEDPMLMNAPGLLTPTGYELWAAVAGTNPELWGGCVVWISDDNVEYRRVGEITGPARYGAVVSNMPAGTNDYDTTSVARVQLYQGALLSGTQLDCDEWRTICFIGGEWVSYRDATLVSGTTFDLDTFRRAGYGSLRVAHGIGESFAAIDEAIFRMPYDKGNVGKEVFLKFQSFNVFGGGMEDLSACVPYSHFLGASEETAPSDFVIDQINVLQTNAAPAITNPGFENDLVDWVDAYGTGTTGWYTQAPGFAGSKKELVKFLGANGNSGWVNNAKIPVKPGERYHIGMMVKTNFAPGTVSGTCGFAYYDAAGAYLGGDWQDPGYNGTTFVNNTYTKYRKVVTVPANAVYARFALGVLNYTGTGALIFDDCEYSQVTANLDEVPNGATYARMFGTYLQGGAPFNLSFGDNLIYNGRFEDVTGFGLVQSAHAIGTDISPGWRVLNRTGDFSLGLEAGGGTGSAYRMFIGQSGGHSIPAGGAIFGNVGTKASYPAQAGDQYILTSTIVWNSANTAPAGVNVYVDIGVYFYDGAANFISQSVNRLRNNYGYDSSVRPEPTEHPYTCPPGTAYMVPFMQCVVENTTGSAYVTPFALVHARFDNFTCRKVHLASAGQPNVLRNTDFNNGTAEWAGASSVTFSTTEGNQVRVGALADGAFAYLFQDTVLGFDVDSYVTYSASCIQIGGNAGLGSKFQLYLEFYQGATYLGASSGINVIPDTTLPFKFTRFSVTGRIPPGNCDMVRAAIVMEGPQSLFAMIQPKLEKGPFATAYVTGADGTYSQGLVHPGSRRRIGDQRNLPQSIATNYGSVRTTSALTANSSGQVTVNAHTVRYGGTNVAYNAVTNAVTGLTVGVTYVIYCYDEAFDGGTRTWYAGSNPDAVMQLGDGVVVAGQILIPSSGSGSGGGGGVGSPGDWCVDADMLLADGQRAGDVQAGDLIHCWDDNADNPGIAFVEVESNEVHAGVSGRTITTTSGAEVTASDSTPMTLRDGSTIRFPDMLGHDALVRDEFGSLSWERVVDVSAPVLLTVAKIKVHQRCYFAGRTASATIATHNPILKP